MNPLTVLRFGVDTLECTFKGEMNAEAATRIATAKAHAKSCDGPVPVSIGDRVLFVQPKGAGFYPWLLTDRRILLPANGTNGGPPPCSIRFRADALATFGHRELYDEARKTASILGFAFPNTLSRIDLAVDVQGVAFNDQVMDGLVCPATYRARHEDGEGLTYQFGKGDIVLRVYNKTAQLKAYPRKRGYSEVWETCVGYERDVDVWRIEYQFRGQALSEFGCRDVHSSFDRLPGLYAAGLGWGQLREPTPDTNKKRWPIHPWWNHIESSLDVSRPVSRIRVQSRILEQDALRHRLVGIVAAYGAHLGTSDYWSILETLSTDTQIHIQQEGLDLERLVKAKQRQLMAGMD